MASTSRSRKHSSSSGSSDVVNENYRKVFFFVPPEAEDKSKKRVEIPRTELLVSNRVTNKRKRFKHFFRALTKLFKAEKCTTVYHLRNNDNYLDLKLINEVSEEIEVRILCRSLYLIGFRKVNPETQELEWYELREAGPPREIPNSKAMGYTGNYNHIGGNITCLNLHKFDHAIGKIYRAPDPFQWKKYVGIIIKTICESLRFKRVCDHFLSSFSGKVRYATNWSAFEKDWKNMSRIIWKHEQDRNWIMQPVTYGGVELKSVKKVKKAVNLIMPKESCCIDNFVN